MNDGFILYYELNIDFVGIDYFVFDYQGVDKVIEIDVMDLEDNFFVVDDEFYMMFFEGQVEIDVLENDFFGLDVSCVQLVVQLEYGIVFYNFQVDGWGVFCYILLVGFIGVDWFIYIFCFLGGIGSQFEIVIVYVFVSKYEFFVINFQMSMFKLILFVVGYSVFIQFYFFDIIESGNLGFIIFFEGDVDMIILG